MKDKFLSAIEQYSMFSPGDTVAVGVSGGADSMCLLSLLTEYAGELGITVTAVHVNHCIRGAEADRDEEFVRGFCDSRGIELLVKRADVPALARLSGEGTELTARKERYKAFREAGTSRIATAHTGSDAAETLLMNLSRGASLRGLCSIPPVRGNIVRPLIGCTREDTERYCRENGIAFVTDSTNLTDEYTRNRYRHTVVPALAAIQPSFEANALRCLAALRRDEDYLAGQTEELFRLCYDPGSRSLNVSRLETAHESLRYRVLFRFIAELSDADAETKHVEALLDGMHTGCAVTLPSGLRIRSDGTRLFPEEEPAERPPAEERLIDCSVPCSFEFGSRIIRLIPSDTKKTPDKSALCVDFSKIDDIIKVRPRHSGDAVVLPRRGCGKTLKKLFNELKIPPCEREDIPVFCDSSGIIAVGGITCDASRLPDKNTEKYLIIITECGKNE